MLRKENPRCIILAKVQMTYSLSTTKMNWISLQNTCHVKSVDATLMGFPIWGDGTDLLIGVPSEGQRILSGESLDMVKAGSHAVGWQGAMETLLSEAHRQSPRKAGEQMSGLQLM